MNCALVEGNMSQDKQQILPNERSNIWKRLHPSNSSLEPRLDPYGINLMNRVKTPPTPVYNWVKSPPCYVDNDISQFPVWERNYNSLALGKPSDTDSTHVYTENLSSTEKGIKEVTTVAPDAVIDCLPVQVSTVLFQPTDYVMPMPVPVTNVVPSFTDEAVSNQTDILTNIWPMSTDKAKIEHPEFCNMYDSILAAAKPNCIGARLQVHSALNLDEWDKLLENYHDKEICLFLRYDWPIGFHDSSPPFICRGKSCFRPQPSTRSEFF